MPCVGFELTIPASERAKTVRALDRSATVIGNNTNTYRKHIPCSSKSFVLAMVGGGVGATGFRYPPPPQKMHKVENLCRRRQSLTQDRD
jgi:hypothetical protein